METIKKAAESLAAATNTPRSIYQAFPSEQCECNGTGWILDEQTKRVRCCPCRRRRIASEVVPPRYRFAALSDFSANLYEQGESLLRRMHRGLVSHKTGDGRGKNSIDGLLVGGPVGTGKTHLAAALAIELGMAGFDVIFKCASALYLEVRVAMQQNSEYTRMMDYCRSSVLVIDDLGAGNLSDFERRVALEIVDSRLNQLRPTIVTSNWSLGEISERMDDRLASRLANFERISLSGDDRRLSAGA